MKVVKRWPFCWSVISVDESSIRRDLLVGFGSTVHRMCVINGGIFF